MKSEFFFATPPLYFTTRTLFNFVFSLQVIPFSMLYRRRRKIHTLFNLSILNFKYLLTVSLGLYLVNLHVHKPCKPCRTCNHAVYERHAGHAD